MIIRSLPIFLFSLSVACVVHGQETLNNYLKQCSVFLEAGGKWIAKNKNYQQSDTTATSYHGFEFHKGINENTIIFKSMGYLPFSCEWITLNELQLTWDAKKQNVVAHGVSSEKDIIRGEALLITAKELQLALSITDAGGGIGEYKEIFNLKEGKLEVGGFIKQNNKWQQATMISMNRLEQPAGNLTFMSTRDGNFEIYSMDAKGENLRNWSCNKATDYAFSYTPDKKIVYYTDRDGNDEVYIMEADGKKTRNLTNNPAGDRIPFASPDGTKILFISDRDDKNGEIYVMDIDGKNIKRITNNGYFEDAASWSPDGKKILFSRELRDLKDTSRNSVTNGEVFIMDAGGTNEMQLTNRPGYDGGPQISPDGKRIAFYGKSEKNKYDIFLIDIDGKNLINLTSDDAEDYSPSWSPDGKWIACTRRDSKNYDIWVIHIETGIKTRLTTNLKRDESPIWWPK
jgi:TolB protein